MAFTRASGFFSASVFQRACCNNSVCSSSMRMLSNSCSPQPPKIESGSSKRYAFSTVAGGLLTCCGLGYAYNAFTSDRFDPSKQLKWIQEKIGWENVKLSGKMVILQNANPVAKFTGSDNEARCEGKTECPSKCEESTCLHKMDKEEEVIVKANADLEKALKDVKPKVLEATEIALKAFCEAADIIKLFMDKAYCAIEHDDLETPQFEEVWCDVYDTALKRCEKVIEALTRAQCAWEYICRLRDLINNGKACKYTQCNPLLITSEEAMLCAERELLNAKARMDCVQSDSCLVEQYREFVENFRGDLKAEVEAVLANNPECKPSFCTNECPMILAQAYKMVLRAQKELAQAEVCGGKMPPKQEKTLC